MVNHILAWLKGLDLSTILGQFDKVERKLDQYLDHIAEQQLKISNRQQSMRAKQRDLEERNAGLTELGQRAARVKTRVREFKA